MEKDKAYLSDWLWLPKQQLSKSMLEASLVVEVGGQLEQLWIESEHHYGVPRKYYQEDQLFDFDIVDIRPQTYQEAGIRSLITLDRWEGNPDRMQRDAFEDLLLGEEGVLNMACGKGKTVILLHIAAHYGMPTLVINDKLHILDQWRTEALGDPTEEPPQLPKLELDGEIGWIQGPPRKWKWRDCPLVFASLKTLAIHVDAISEELRRYPGVIIWDEAHHLPAPTYLRTAHTFYGIRLAATATVRRADGGEIAMFAHVGPILHQNLEQELTPSAVMLRSPTEIDMQDQEVVENCYSVDGEVHHKLLAAYVGQLPQEVAFARSVIDSATKRGRDILAITVSKDHANLLHQYYPESCVIHGDVDPRKRLKLLRSHKLTFATVNSAAEAIDKVRLDTLMILTEFGSDIWFTQSIGRTQRSCEGAPPPKIVVLWHNKVHMLKGMGHNITKKFERAGISYRVV